MKSSLVTKVIYRTIFCTVSLFSVLFISGFFSVGGSDTATFHAKDIFYFYTNLSNYLCLGVMIAVLREDVRRLRAGELYGYSRNPYLKFCKFAATVIITITFLVYGFILGDPLSLNFWNNIANLCYHVAGPILFIIDTLLFDEHKSVGVLDPLLALIPPLLYVIVIEIMGTQSGRYPYFFLNVQELGLGGLMIWIAVLLLLFLALGYLFFLYDKLVRIDGKWRLDFSDLKLFGFSKGKH
ncbi:MAG: Pr6Pr family membrane protein [Clostridia bacterium]|nr:Pr6Pr family membrane protein [Clostridia bacterium]